MNIREKTRQFWRKLDRGRYKRKVRRGMIRKYKAELEMACIMERWITKRILEGQQGRRQELIDMQARIKETEALILFLKTA